MRQFLLDWLLVAFLLSFYTLVGLLIARALV
jgi:hypothetical protein